MSSQKSLDSPMKKNNGKTSGGSYGQSLKIIGNESGGLFKKNSISIRDTGTPGKCTPLNVKSQKTISSGVDSTK